MKYAWAALALFTFLALPAPALADDVIILQVPPAGYEITVVVTGEGNTTIVVQTDAAVAPVAQPQVIYTRPAVYQPPPVVYVASPPVRVTGHIYTSRPAQPRPYVTGSVYVGTNHAHRRPAQPPRHSHIHSRHCHHRH